jgi:hypothetical protein
MELTDAQYRQIKPWLPTQRGNVILDNLHVLNAILYVHALIVRNRIPAGPCASRFDGAHPANDAACLQDNRLRQADNR